MNKFLSALTALAMVCALSTGAAFAKDKTKGAKAHPKTASTQASTMGKAMSSQCAPGKKYVKGYTKKNGTKVKGYCR